MSGHKVRVLLFHLDFQSTIENVTICSIEYLPIMRLCFSLFKTQTHSLQKAIWSFPFFIGKLPCIAINSTNHFSRDVSSLVCCFCTTQYACLPVSLIKFIISSTLYKWCKWECWAIILKNAHRRVSFTENKIRQGSVWLWLQ